MTPGLSYYTMRGCNGVAAKTTEAKTRRAKRTGRKSKKGNEYDKTKAQRSRVGNSTEGSRGM